MVNTHYEHNRIYQLKHQNSNLTEEELMAKEKRVKTWRNKIKVILGIGGEVLTIKEEQQLKKLRENQFKETQQPATTNKTDQSIWTIKDKKEK